MDVDLNQIFLILSKISYVSVSEIEAGTDIFEDLDVDSLGIVELFVALQKNFDIQLTPTLYTREDIRTPLLIQALLHTAKSA